MPPSLSAPGTLLRDEAGFLPQDEPVNATAAAPEKRLYFVNAPVDFLLIGGASIIMFVFMGLFYSRERTPAAMTVAAQLLWLCNWPHFSASSYRLYHTRDNIRQYPVTALVIPFVVLAGVVGALLSPALVAPYFVKVFSIWSPYHFSGQTLGICLIYARRSGFKVGTWERLGLSGFIYGSFLSGTVRAEIGTNLTEYFGIPYRGLGLPGWTAYVTDGYMWVCGLVFAVLAVRWCLRNRQAMPPMVLLPAATQYIWFVLPQPPVPADRLVRAAQGEDGRGRHSAVAPFCPGRVDSLGRPQHRWRGRPLLRDPAPRLLDRPALAVCDRRGDRGRPDPPFLRGRRHLEAQEQEGGLAAHG
jgi:hypothetical protein